MEDNTTKDLNGNRSGCKTQTSVPQTQAKTNVKDIALSYLSYSAINRRLSKPVKLIAW